MWGIRTNRACLIACASPIFCAQVYLECASLQPTWLPSSDELQDEVYCSWPDTKCQRQQRLSSRDGKQGLQEQRVTPDTQEFSSMLVDWRSTSAAGLEAVIFVNNSANSPSLAPPLQVLVNVASKS